VMFHFFLHDPTAVGWLTRSATPARSRGVAH